MDRKRLNVYVPSPIANKLDEHAKTMGLNRSAMITYIIKQYLDQQDMVFMANEYQKQLLKQNIKEDDTK